MSWFKWDTYLKQGKHKAETHERPMPRAGQTHRVVRLPNGAIGLKLHRTYCVIFHPDDTVTYNTGGWNTVTTRRFISEYGPVRVFTVKGELRLHVANPDHTPPKIQKCRSCKGAGQVPLQCYGPSYCYWSTYSSGGCEHGRSESHRLDVCEHGQTSSHTAGTHACYRCAGTGEVDYGSRAIHPEWDGEPYRFNPYDPTAGLDNVTVYGEPCKPFVPFAPSSVSTPSSTYSGSGTILATLMPDVEAMIGYPCKCESTRGTESSVINVVIHLNDSDRWTRERIADWLDTLDLNLKFPVPVA